MTIHVKVLNAESGKEQEIKEEEKGEILTPEYIKAVNDGIAKRIRSGQIGQIEQQKLQAQVRKRVLK